MAAVLAKGISMHLLQNKAVGIQIQLQTYNRRGELRKYSCQAPSALALLQGFHHSRHSLYAHKSILFYPIYLAPLHLQSNKIDCTCVFVNIF
jgi:hypothetical protein